MINVHIVHCSSVSLTNIIMLIADVTFRCICDKSKRERSKNAPRDENVNRNVPGMSMVPIPGIIPAEYSNEEILKVGGLIYRLQFFSLQFTLEIKIEDK